MKIESAASVSAIVRDASNAHELFGNVLNVSFEGGEGNYVFTEKLPGVKHFGLWPLTEAAMGCFGTDKWPDDMRSPREHGVRGEFAPRSSRGCRGATGPRIRSPT